MISGVNCWRIALVAAFLFATSVSMFGVFQSQSPGRAGTCRSAARVVFQAWQVELSAAATPAGLVGFGAFLPLLMMTAPPTRPPAMTMPAEMMAAGIHRRFCVGAGAGGWG